MFFGKNNNNGNGVNVNTNFETFYSDTAMVSVGGWNKQLSIKVSPATGKDGNGVTQYTREQSQQITTSVTQENALVWIDGYEKILLPAITAKEAKRVSISMGANESKKVLTIGFDGVDAYLEVATSVKDDGTTDPANVLKHKFNKKSYMVDYDSNNGSGTEVTVESGLANFMAKIKASQELTPATAHAINYSNANKAAYAANSKSQGSGDGAGNNGGYSAPSSNYNGSDMGGFLPFN